MPKAATETKTKAATKSANTKPKEGKTKTKRAPSAYNLFMAEHLKKWREENPGQPHKSGMSAVAALWKDAPENPNRGKEPGEKKKAEKENKKAKAAAAKAAEKSDKSDNDEEEPAAEAEADAES